MEQKTIRVQDLKTKETFNVKRCEDRAIIETKDGTKVKIFPQIVSLTVRVQGLFDGTTTLGPRPMRRLC
jgi:hypothetical protein